MSEAKGIEYQFCSQWMEWDQLDTFTLIFMDVTLLPWVAKLTGFTQADSMVVNCDHNTVTFEADEVQMTYKMNVTLGELVE